MGNSVVGVSAPSLTRNFGVATTGNFSLVLAAKWALPVTGTFPAPFFVQQHGTALSFWCAQQDDVGSGDDIYVEYKVGTTNTDTTIGTNTALVSRWIHLCFTYNHSTGAQNIYALLEGFNPANPSFLISPSVGNTTATLPGASDLFVFTDAAAEAFASGKLAHLIICPVELTQAQVIAQFQQRAPTATASGGGAYTYLPCTSAASVHVDTGTVATAFTRSGVFSDSTDQPLEWRSRSAVSFGTNF